MGVSRQVTVGVHAILLQQFTWDLCSVLLCMPFDVLYADGWKENFLNIFSSLSWRSSLPNQSNKQFSDMVYIHSAWWGKKEV